MKRALLLLSFLVFSPGAFAQGTVNFANNSTTAIRTNSIGFGGSFGNTSPVLGGFDYALLTAPSTVTSIDANAQDLLTSTWTFTGLYATNTAATSGGRLGGGANVATLQGWAPGVTNSFIVVGWSTGLGTTWSQIAAQLAGATFFGGLWCGPNWVNSGGQFGVSNIGFGEAGGGPSTLAAFNLFGLPNTQGMPIGTFTDLYGFALSPCPEPSPVALAALGFGAVLVRRLQCSRRRHEAPSNL